MDIERRTMLKGSVVLAAAASLRASAAEATNPLAAFIASDGSAIKAVKVTADDAGTHIAEVAVAADPSPYPLFKQFLTHKASRVAIYAAPPGHRVTVVPSTNQLIYVVAGSLTVMGKDPPGHDCPAGSAILIDAQTRHREHAGPAGFTAIKVALSD
jgi:quercetin dioxygenase-like cupin family protein